MTYIRFVISSGCYKRLNIVIFKVSYILIVLSLLLYNNICNGQIIKDDQEDSIKTVAFIFKTSTGQKVITHNLILTSNDCESVKLLTKKEFAEQYKTVRAFAGAEVTFKPEIKVLNLTQLLEYYHFNGDHNNLLVSVNNSKPVHKRNLYVSTQAVESLRVDYKKQIIYIILKPE
ncbi:hypothetical protein ACFQ3S_08730 [Mucilaginibacter terrae]|uniref:hypothetical protein n=1 Tax=Mucilaginibacter terrae TaxID=1955052 RepID=UPI003632EB7A